MNKIHKFLLALLIGCPAGCSSGGSSKCVTNVVYNTTYEFRKIVPFGMERYLLDRMDNVHPFSATHITVPIHFVINRDACMREGDENLQIYLKVVDTNSASQFGSNDELSTSFLPYTTDPMECDVEACNVKITPNSNIGHNVYMIVGTTTQTVFHTIEYEVHEKFILSSPTVFSLPFEIGYVDVHVGSGSYFTTSMEKKFGIQAWGPNWHVYVGNFCSIADGLRMILDGDYEHNYRSPTTYPFGVLTKNENHIKKSKEGKSTTLSIGNDVWIGDSVTLIGAITIGDGAVIGANAVVRHDVPAYAIVIGNPAQVIKYRFNEIQIQKFLEIKWWNWEFEEIQRSKLDELETDEFLDRYYDHHEDNNHEDATMLDGGSKYEDGDNRNSNDANDTFITRTLDLGCGSSPLNLYNATYVYGIDIAAVEPVSDRGNRPKKNGATSDANEYKHRNKNIKIVDLAVEKIPFPSNYFDYVTAKDFLEHIPRVLYISEYDQMSNHEGKPMKIVRRNSFIDLMEEIYRVLKPNGIFYSFTPIYPHAGAFQDPTHVNFLTVETFAYYFDDQTRWAYRFYNFTGGFKIDHMEMSHQHLIVKMLKTPQHQLHELEEMAEYDFLNAV